MNNVPSFPGPTPLPVVVNAGAGPLQTSDIAALPFSPVSNLPSFDDVMHNLRNAARTSCLVPCYAAEKIAESRAQRCPTAINNWDNFAGMGLDVLYAHTQAIKPAYVIAAHQTWKNTARQIADAVDGFGADVHKLGDRWEGEVQRRVAKGAADYLAAADRLVNWATAIAYNLDNLADAVNHTKTSVSPPPDTSVYDDVMDWFDDRNTHAYDNLKQQAVVALQQVYQPGLNGADAPPVRPFAHNPVAAAAGPLVPHIPPLGPTSGTGAGWNPMAGSGVPTHGATSGSQPTEVQEKQQAGGSNGPGGNTSPLTTGSAQQPQRTDEASVAGSDPIASGELEPGVGMPAGDSGLNSGGTGSLAAPPSIGVPTGSAPNGGVFRVAAPAVGSAVSGMPGIPAVGSPRRDAEKQHRSPSYLISLDKGNKLIGPLGKATPPVIGVWNEDGTHKTE